MLNIWSLNSNVVYHHFKIDPILNVTGMFTPTYWMASFDFKMPIKVLLFDQLIKDIYTFSFSSFTNSQQFLMVLSAKFHKNC